MDLKALILIPARGGSKGLPEKNLKEVGGIPLVGLAARLGRNVASQLDAATRVICSTDDDAIASAAREWGAEIPFHRPAALASDTAKSIDVVLHALDALADDDFDAVVLLQPTSPLTAVEDVLGALELHCLTRTSVVSVCPAEHPAAWQYTVGSDGTLVQVSTGEIAHRRQDVEVTYRLNGAVYVSSPKDIRKNRGFLGPATRAYVMPGDRSIDIDSAWDLQIARAVVQSRSPEPVQLGNRLIGPGHPCFIIAEAGVNHNGERDLALRLVDIAAQAGADAVKFQTFQAARLATPEAPKADYQVRATGAEESQFEMLRRLELSEELHHELMDACKDRGILFLSSPFDEQSADLLGKLRVAGYKIPSGEITNLPFLSHVARKGLPVILSTGMSTLDEVETAVRVINEVGNSDLVLLHCVSQYPADPADVNLRAMATLREAFGVPVGFSDHTTGIEVPLVAVGLGAAVIEKHFTIDRTLPGPDHLASIDAEALAAMVQGIRKVEKTLGTGHKAPAMSERSTADVARKSVVAARDIPSGTVLTMELLAVRRPGTGLPPTMIDSLLGRRANTNIPAGSLLTLEQLG
ncbi:MAG: N-acetylneuraminate synthase [bacterium]